VRSDNGLIVTARRFRAAWRGQRLSPEFITPYIPEQNGMIERFFRSLKEECVWQHDFAATPRPAPRSAAGSAGTTSVVPIRRSAT